MSLLDTDKAQAVIFFDNEGVVKELLYPEFEALLDGFVPLEEWADRTLKGVYLEFDSTFSVSAAVFFLVSFDKNGAIEASWNMPLMDLARTASKGPDLGAGPIHLVCSSQCPVAFYKNALWDPDMKSHSSHFSQIKKALKRNRLGVHFKPTQKEPSGGGFSPQDAQRLEQRLSAQLGKQYEQELRDYMAQLMKDQRLRIATMTSDKEQALQEVRLEYGARLEALQQQLEDKGNALADANERNSELTATIDGQVQKIEGLREYFEHKLQRAQGNDTDYIESLKTQYQAETEAKIDAATRELSELLKMKEVELLYRIEHEDELRAEIDRLREQSKELLANSGDHLLEKLSRKGVNFVTYQAGAGHITIPLSEIPSFVDSPSAFTANYCGISEKHYMAWLKHYQSPVCSAMDENDEMCCVDVTRVVNPVEFIVGESNCCERHNSLRRKESS